MLPAASRRTAFLAAAVLGVAALAYGGYRLRPAPARHRAPPRTGPALIEGRSCAGAAGADRRCGAGEDTDCCDRRVVPGGTFQRSFDAAGCADGAHPATISDLALDTYEVTVGRFRAFMAAGKGTRAVPPAPGEGEHPRIPGSGWDPSWNAQLAPDAAALGEKLQCNRDTANWTPAPGDNERLPINCLTFYEAFAFCAWDGGRLPTEAEWNYAAAGGAEQRVYPWSTPPSAAAIDERHAVYAQPRARPVGSRSPRGDARWGHADLSGNVWEWTLDTADPGKLLPTEGAGLCPSAGYLDPCRDCAQLDAGPARVTRSGGYGLPGHAVITSMRRAAPPAARFHVFGARCAHDLRGAASGTPTTSVAPTTSAAPATSAAPTCAPRCAGRACGPDGCGGACGACPDGAPCSDLGHCPPPRYPPGPHACATGAIIPDFALTGFVDPSAGVAAMTPVRLGDFYNPTGRDTYPPGSPLGPGKPRPRALLVHFAALWSDEAKAAAPILGALHARSGARGGAVLSLLLEGARHGQQADSYNVVEWARASAAAYPSLMDPERRVQPCVSVFPAGAVIDTRTMRVVALSAGSPRAADSALVQAYEALLTPP